MSGGERFFLKAEGYPWIEVTEADWCFRERLCGFRPTGPWTRATGGFNGFGWSGIYTTPENHARFMELYPDLPR